MDNSNRTNAPPAFCFLRNFVRLPINDHNTDIFMQQRHLLALAKELGLLRSTNAEEVEDLGSAARAIEHVWEVRISKVAELQSIPERMPHSGDYEWQGPEDTRLPRYLWDACLSKTVVATDDRLQEGYIAVSYTWGRWQVGSMRQEGTNWSVPKIDPRVNEDMLETLKTIVAGIPFCRYYWIDVLCINQDDEEDKRREISKQASIFGCAKAVLVYLWSLERDDLAQAIAHLGDVLLWSLYFAEPQDRALSNLEPRSNLPDHIKPLIDAKLRLDPWFSSLWALQEIVLAPSAIWMTRYGHTCLVNDHILTTRFMSLAVELLQWSYHARELHWKELLKDYRVEDRMRAAAELSIQAAEFQRDAARIEEQWTKSATEEERISIISRVEDIQPLRYWVTDSKDIIVGCPAWMSKRLREEIPLSRSSKRWISWATSEACITVSIRASRGAIIVAGVNRRSTKRRAEALLAALKIAPRQSFLEGNESLPGGLPASLMNYIIELEGSPLFFVAHDYKFQMETRKEGSPLYLQWTLGPPPDGSGIHITESGAPWHYRSGFLSSMLPNTGTTYHPRPIDMHNYHPVTTRGWHLHSDGTLHLPHGTIMQQFSLRDVGKMVIWTNAWSAEGDNDLLALAGMQVAHQDACMEYLGEHCWVKFLPILIREQTNSFISLGEPFAPKVIGIILVGNPSMRKSDSMAYWHKFGLYATTTYKQDSLDWHDGILVGQMGIEPDKLCNNEEFFSHETTRSSKWRCSTRAFADFVLRLIPRKVRGYFSNLHFLAKYFVCLVVRRLSLKWAESYDRKGLVHFSRGHYSMARTMFLKSLEIRRPALGDDSPGVQENKECLIETYLSENQFEEAADCQLEIINQRILSLGPNSPLTLGSSHALANTYQRQGRYKDAERLLVDVTDAMARVMGPDHRDTIVALEDLGKVYIEQELLQNAEQVFVELVNRQKRVFGSEDRRTLTAVSNLAFIYMKQGKWQLAEPLALQALNGLKKSCPPDSLDVLGVMQNLGRTFFFQERFDEAEAMQVEVMKSFMKQLGENDDRTLDIMVQLASTYSRQNRSCEAQKLQELVFERRLKTQGLSHPLTEQVLHNLLVNFINHNRWEEVERLGNRLAQLPSDE
ncbi:hypothetical protein BDV30DRAFT_236011 [Aspergillus minisclerotigenes]|uniref:Heterokaryon incompatibility domain-containing protein n=1 Tax=Aspergillus minisclerotigenes TaxID=656917 RepID=A0A5N6JDX9_9EURO|nr:hypothetical protein BDV30DRAFT_236011 [Aspergillus minisclerotigenes]